MPTTALYVASSGMCCAISPASLSRKSRSAVMSRGRPRSTRKSGLRCTWRLVDASDNVRALLNAARRHAWGTGLATLCATAGVALTGPKETRRDDDSSTDGRREPAVAAPAASSPLINLKALDAARGIANPTRVARHL